MHAAAYPGTASEVVAGQPRVVRSRLRLASACAFRGVALAVGWLPVQESTAEQRAAAMLAFRHYALLAKSATPWCSGSAALLMPWCM